MVRRFWGRFRRPTADAGSPVVAQPASPPSAAPPPAVSPDDLANPAIERLAEDEALRGDLTDDGYLPLQNWAFARLQRIAHEAVHHPDPQAAMDGYTSQIRAFVQAAVRAAESGDLGDLAALVKPRVALQKDVPALVDALRKVAFTGDADANAQAIASALTVEGSAG
jgi:hypothetical protein